MSFNTKLGEAYNANCFEVMEMMPDGCVDMILADLPYGTTACKWDTVIPFEPMWKEFHRIAKPNAAIVLTASQPFTSALVMSNVKKFKCSWVWEKHQGTNPICSKYQPMKVHEDVLVFSRGTSIYNPEMTRGKPYSGFRDDSKTQGAIHGAKTKSSHRDNPSGDRFPRSVQFFKGERGLHPTQKPVALFEYLIKTYTNEGDLVFDPTAGSLTTGVAAENLNRRWIVSERDEGYFTKGKARFTANCEPASAAPDPSTPELPSRTP